MSIFHNRHKKVILAGSTALIYKVITVITGLISIPLTMDYLGSERFGIWMICTSILSFIVFSDLGLGKGLLNAISKYNATNNKVEIKKSISSVMFILISISLLLCIVMYFTIPYVNWGGFFNVKSEIAIRESKSVIIIMSIIIAINIPLGVVQNIQIGFQNTHSNNIWLTFGALLSLGSVLFGIYCKAGLPFLIISLMGGNVVANLLNGIVFFVKNPDYIPSYKFINIDTIGKMLKAGNSFFLLQLFSLMANSMDNIIIAQISGASAVSTYAIVKKLFILTQIGQYFIAPYWPVFNESIAKKEYIWAKETLIKILKTSLFFGFICASITLIFGGDIINIWVGGKIEPSFHLLLGMFFWTFIINYGGCMSVFLNNDIFVHKQLVIVGVTSLSSLIFEIIFCYIYGIEGIIYGVILGHLLFFVIPSYKLAFIKLDDLIKRNNLMKRIDL